MAYTIFNQKLDNAMNEGISWFGIILVVMFCNLAKIHIQLTLKLLLSYIDDTLSVYCAIIY